MKQNEKLKIEYVGIDEVKPYKNNAKKHPPEQIEQIKKSIEKFGMDDPIGIWKDEIVEGHGRLIACKELGFTEIPIIRLDHLTDEVEESIEDLSKEVALEEKKIKKTLDGLSQQVLEINQELIHNVAFQSVQLRHLSSYIATHGVKEKYKNGNNQWGWKDRTEVKKYNNMMKSYQSCMKQLNDLLANNYIGTNSFEDDDLID